MESEGIGIDFAYRTFRWDSEALQKAHVHCVIVGFSCLDEGKKKALFNENGEPSYVSNINGYLVDGENAFIDSRSKPICDVPEIGIGNKPIDDGNYLFTKEEMEDFIKIEPLSKDYFMPWYGSREFINRSPRYCLLLKKCPANVLRKMPHAMKRVEAVKQFRLSSRSAGTKKLAETPLKFHVENFPESDYIVIPEVSSERREYVPMGYLTPESLCSNLVRVMPNASLYHFGVLESSVHMGWMRAVCGRLKSDYRYSKDVVYNNFPWPEVTKAQKERIETTAKGILDAREKHPELSFADMYDALAMPDDLRAAHIANDKAVKKAFKFSSNLTESQIVAQLLKLYKEKVESLDKKK